MTVMGFVRPVASVALLLAVAGCAERGGGAADPEPGSSVPAAADGLVLRVDHTGGFVTPSMLAGRLPTVSVYADGRVLSEGPVPAVHPGPALPNLQVGQIEAGAVQELVDRALAAGVAESGDLGMPPVADAPSTRFTVITADDTYVREVYALWESGGTSDSGLTADQEAARAKLSDLLATLTDGSATATDTTSYEPDALAAVVWPWIDPQDGLTQPEQPWPGPGLPGEPMGGPADVSCVVATGEDAQALLDATRSANAATPWVTVDGARWSVLFRPLLPDETGCADLTG
jgi:hypothetical protein